MDLLLEKIIKNYHGPVSDEAWIRWPKNLEANRRDFWKGNDVWDDFYDIKTPLLIFASKKDPMVTYDLNSGLLESGKRSLGNTPWMLVPLKESIHCTLGSAYDWHEQTAIFSSYFRSFSPDLKMMPLSIGVPLKPDSRERIANDGFHPEFNVEIKKGELQAQVRIRFLPTNDANWWQRLWAPEQIVAIPLAKLDFLQAGPVETQAEIDLFTRWLNQNLEVQMPSPTFIKLHWLRVVSGS